MGMTERGMSQEPWIFVSAANIAEPAWIWLREQIDLRTWDHTYDGFWFMHEQDAIMFALRWS
jgi:hypothetical protein